jgi:taurine dioxygenase
MDDATFKFVHDTFVEHEVIVLHDQMMTADQQLAFGRRFGPLSVHPFAPSDDEVNELIVFDNKEDNPPWGTDVWHSDETFRAEPPMATILRAKIVPDYGGDTMFASMTAAYEGLSDRMQHFISGLEGIHDFKPFRKLFGKDADAIKSIRHFEDLYPPVLHPVVREHPVSGKKALFVSPQFTIAIDGMEERESRWLLDFLFQQALIPEYQYRHHWKPNTLAMWDNRSVQHYAIHDYYPQRRSLERVTIKGDRPFGPKIEGPQLGVYRPKFQVKEGASAHGGHAPKRQFERDKDKVKYKARPGTAPEHPTG